MNNETKQCCVEVRKKGLNFLRTRACKKPATVEVNGKWYCSVHNPEAVAERQTKQKQKQEQRRKDKAQSHLIYLKAKALHKRATSE